MKEIIPGIYHWTAHNPHIGQDVSSYFITRTAVLLDPKLPSGGVQTLEKLPRRPEHIVLTNRLHYRDSAEITSAFGCSVWCSRPGLQHQIDAGRKARAFDFGQTIHGAQALEIDVICPDETALFFAEEGAVAIADGLIRDGEGPLGFVPDSLLGDDPDAIKNGLRSAYRSLLELDFEHLIFAHGVPLVGTGKTELRKFLP